MVAIDYFVPRGHAVTSKVSYSGKTTCTKAVLTIEPDVRSITIPTVKELLIS